MENIQDFSSINCEIQIIRGRNIEQISSLGKSNLFVRCYLPTGDNNQRVKLNSQEISSKSDLFWDESFSLDCMGTQDSINMMKQGTIVFELRSRKCLPIFGGSQLLGRAEVPWKRVFESREMEIEEWAILMDTSKNLNEDVKPPALKIVIKVKVINETTKVNKLMTRSWDESCACKGYCGCNSNSSIFSADDYEIFALGAALEAL